MHLSPSRFFSSPRPSHLRRGLALLVSAVLLLVGGCSSGNDIDDPQAVVDIATQELNTYDFTRAAELLGQVYNVLPEDHPLMPEVTFMYAMALWHLTPPTPEQVTEASRLFRTLAEAQPQTPWSREARLNLARVQMLRDYPDDPPQLAAARETLRPLIEGEPVDHLTHEAALRYGESLCAGFENRENIEQGITFLESWLADYPDNPFAATMWEFVGEQYMGLPDKPAEAHDAFRQALELGPASSSNLARFLWRLARLADEDLNRPDLTVEYLLRILRETPRTGRVWEASQWLKRIKATEPGFADLEIPAIPS